MACDPFAGCSDAVLHCPVCEGEWLHHGRVEVFERPREDAQDGLQVTVQGLQVQITTDLTGNPSARRDGLRLYEDAMRPEALLLVLVDLITEARLAPGLARRMEELVLQQTTQHGQWK